MVTISLALRTAHDDGTLVYEDVDLDALSPRARTLAETVAQRPLRTPGPVWCASRETVRDLIPDAETWYRPDELDRPLHRVWESWSLYPADSTMTTTQYLEQQARRIPSDYAILGANPRQSVESAEIAKTDEGMTRAEVLAYLREAGRPIAVSTWSSYVARGQAPRPARYVARTPLWDPAEVKDFAKKS